jgi:hypothetical protein
LDHRGSFFNRSFAFAKMARLRRNVALEHGRVAGRKIGAEKWEEGFRQEGTEITEKMGQNDVKTPRFSEDDPM